MLREQNADKDAMVKPTFESAKGDALKHCVVPVNVNYNRYVNNYVFSDSRASGDSEESSYRFNTDGTFRRENSSSYTEESGSGEMWGGTSIVISPGTYSATGTLVHLIARCTITESEASAGEKDEVGESFTFDSTSSVLCRVPIDPETPHAEWKSDSHAVAWTASPV